ncbi:hypothetical protein GM160_00720 [Guyparkeria halophila]|uniref:Uncharacterized protein n=1 Tax=Guyparkeria halophila TaxID=47960 RepID=A0A6I6CW53_9GAMM|nr:hypothetical protein [Guyparkeria halophila]QGT77520.1 hypothetical protein GM160_00720 [Guyparkeria halophila]
MIPYVVSVPHGHHRLRIGQVPYLAAMASHPEDSDKWEGQEERFHHLVLKVWHRIGSEWPDSDTEAAKTVRQVIPSKSHKLTPHQLIHLFLGSLYKKRIMQAVQDGALTIKRHARPIEEMDVAPDEWGWQSFRDGDWVTINDLSAWLAGFGIEVRENDDDETTTDDHVKAVITERKRPSKVATPTKLASPEESSIPPKRQCDSLTRVDWIKEEIQKRGHDPLNPPTAPAGKPSIKAELRELAVKERPPFFRNANSKDFVDKSIRDAFNNAWDILRKEIRHHQSNKPPS